MPKLMTDLRMREVSGVDRAANLAEGWLLMKSASPGAQAVLKEAMGLDQDGGSEPSAVERTHAMPTEAEELAKALESLPEPLRKVLADSNRRAVEAEEEVRKERERRELDEATAVAKSLDSVPEVTPEFGEVIVKARHGDSEAVEALIGALTKSNAALKVSKAFEEIGSGHAAEGTGAAGLEGVAKALREANPELSQAEALAKAAEQNPELYAQHRAEMNRENRS